MDVGLLGERQLQVGHLDVDLVQRVAHPEAHVGRDLVVARTAGMQAAGGEPDLVLEIALDVHVDVFERTREREAAGLDLGLDLLEPGAYGGHIILGEDAGLAQHGGMRERAPDVLPPQPLVEIDGGVDLLHDGVGT